MLLYIGVDLLGHTVTLRSPLEQPPDYLPQWLHHFACPHWNTIVDTLTGKWPSLTIICPYTQNEHPYRVNEQSRGEKYITCIRAKTVSIGIFITS